MCLRICNRPISLCFNLLSIPTWRASQVAVVVKNPPANAGDTRVVGSILGWGISSGGGHGNPLKYSCLENPMDRGPCWATVYGSQRVRHTWSDFACTPHEKVESKLFQHNSMSLLLCPQGPAQGLPQSKSEWISVKWINTKGFIHLLRNFPTSAIILCVKRKNICFLSYNKERLKNLELQGHTLEAYLKA